jgi:hypothetical protein
VLCQLLAVALSAVKRFEAVGLHAWSSVRDVVESLRAFRSGGEADLGVGLNVPSTPSATAGSVLG